MAIRLIHTTIKRFSDVANARGLDKTRLIQTQRRQLEDPGRGRSGNFYGPAVTALRKGLFADNVEQYLAEMLDQCTPGQHGHFAQIAEGMHRLIHRFGVVGVVSAPRGLWQHHDLEVNVTGMLGVRLSTGEQQAWILHMQPTPLDERAADIPLCVADAMLALRDSPLNARVVDVRRAATYVIRNDRQRADLRCLVEAEAEAYISLWRTAA